MLWGNPEGKITRKKPRQFGVNVDVGVNRDDPHWFARVNWAAIGPVTPKQARIFAGQILQAADYCDCLIMNTCKHRVETDKCGIKIHTRYNDLCEKQDCPLLSKKAKARKKARP
jgi:hypothetical protein